MPEAPRLRGLDPVATPGARLLILGSMPGAASLAAGEYYAHPRNAFWPIMGALAGAGPGLAYPERLERLRGAGIALWDVLGSCLRDGSLDSAIREGVPNDFAAFLAAHPHIARIGLNGGTAAALFRRHVAPLCPPRIAVVALPSTSPAHARLSLRDKCERWRDGLAMEGGG